MSAQILDGKLLAAQLKHQLRTEIQDIVYSTGQTPVLNAVSFLKDPAIESYATSQQKTAISLGFEYKHFQHSPSDEKEAVDFLKSIFASVPGALFVFKPLPAHIDFNAIHARIADMKNIEGIDPLNLGNLFLGIDCVIPPTPAAAMALLKFAGVPLQGKTAVIVGRSDIVGKPLVHLLLHEDVTVSVCHSKTPIDQLIAMLKSADIVMACVGKPGFIKKEWIKPGAIVIDVGINDVAGQIKGDVADDVKDVAGYITPVPGGVGPVTSVMLMKNVLDVFKKIQNG